MAYQIIYKKRFLKKLLKLLDYLKTEWNKDVADKFIDKLQKRLETLAKQPFIGISSAKVNLVRSILITRQNRIFYRMKGNVIEIVNMYDTRSNPKKNKYK